MKLTNHRNIPDVFENYAKVEVYDSGGADFTPSSLGEPAMIRHLSAVNKDKLTEDISDNIMSILGTAIHSILEKGCNPGDKVEERMWSTIIVDDVKYNISGCADRMFQVGEGWTLQDYKSTSASTIKHNPDGKSDWVAQLSIYCWLADKNGMNVTKSEVVCIVRDWVKSQAKYGANSGYPQAAVQVVPIEPWSLEETEEYMRLRIRALTAKLPAECTPEERWQGATKYAVKAYVRGGGLSKRATKIFNSSYDAEEFMLEQSINGEVEVRPGTPNRCDDWCPVSGWCDQRNRERNEEDNR